MIDIEAKIEEMYGRCAFVYEVDAAHAPADVKPLSFGFVMTARSGARMLVEVGLGETGHPSVTMTPVTAGGEPTVPQVIATAEQVMVLI